MPDIEADIPLCLSTAEVVKRANNSAPVLGSSTTREVQENAAESSTVGAAVVATDTETLTYSLDDPSGNFEIDATSGQITVASERR